MSQLEKAGGLYTPLEFKGDAISLSGAYGTKRKTEIISSYYDFWLSVVARNRFVQTVYIVEMDAGTGELYFKDTKTQALGSAGHSMALRYDSTKRYSRKLNVILVEEDAGCRKRMDRVISRRWPKAVLTQRDGKSILSNDGGARRFKSVKDFLNDTQDGADLGISLFYFDPLLAVEWSLLDTVANARITSPYKIGTEFLIFFFTSDWLAGRKDPFFHPLPKSKNESSWSDSERYSAEIADKTFGNRKWLDVSTSSKKKSDMEKNLVKLYKRRLRKWFRFVVPLPFEPKRSQTYHVFCCSNYDVGISVIRSIYTKYMQPFGLEADNAATYKEFQKRHPSFCKSYTGSRKPPEWKVLWHVMRNCTDGLCDLLCETLHEKAESVVDLKKVFRTLVGLKYLKEVKVQDWPWKAPKFPIYQIDWNTVKSKLGVKKPKAPIPLTPP